MLTVACVKARPKFGADYVNNLHRMVRDHLSVPHRFVCLTDDDSGLECEALALPEGLTGWWGKIALFKPGMLTPPVLYLDLDTLIVDDLSFVTEYTGTFAILRDFYRPNGYGSGVMLWTEPLPYVWTHWDEAGRPDNPLGDQGWMESTCPGAHALQDLYPGKFCSFKADDCDDGMPESAAVMCFHGYPKPHELEPQHWASRVWEGEPVSGWMPATVRTEQRLREAPSVLAAAVGDCFTEHR